MSVAAAGFGGCGSPYEQVMDGHHAGPLTLLPVREATRGPRPVTLAVDRFLAVADATDIELLARTRGPVLDVGCGPGRMVRAALQAGRPALGVDVSPAAVRHANRAGLPVLHRSVFEPLPREGGWSTVLLLDGNVGIGGDPSLLLARVAALIGPGGVVVAECHPQRHRDHRFEAVVMDGFGRIGEPFGWAEVGGGTLARLAQRAGLAPVDRWLSCGRRFVALGRR